MAVSIWILARLVGLADFWLHLTSKSTSVTRSIPVDPSGEYKFSVRFNDTICPAEQAKSNETGIPPWMADYYPCLGSFDDFVYDLDGLTSTTGFKAMTNESSSAWSVISLADAADLAILIPGTSVDTQNKSFTSSTFGIQADCYSLNARCNTSVELDQRGVSVNCANAGYPQFPHYNAMSAEELTSGATLINDFIFGIVNGTMLDMMAVRNGSSISPETSNPAHVAIQLGWDPRNEGGANDLHISADLSEIAVDYLPSSHIVMYAVCSVPFFNATVRRDGDRNTWSLVDRTLSSSDLTTTLWIPTLYQKATEHLSSALLTIARSQTKGPVMAALNQHLARLMLGAAAVYVEPTKATDVRHVVDTLLGQYSVAPVLTFILLLCLYAFLALLVFLSSWWTADQTILPPDGVSTDAQGTSMLALTQMWLTNPIPLVGGVYPGDDKRDEQDVTRSMGESDGRVVYKGHISDVRLGVGLTKDGFGIWKRPVGQRVTEVEEP
ncbi:hypothetical protein FRC00_009752 [Tulasnella sp. 408]|nr:hypothetical protein FRC00_009752 [Tulasnella sp. 408]